MPTGIGLYRDASTESESEKAISANTEDRFLSTFWEFIRFHNLRREQEAFRELGKKLRSSHAFSIDLYSYYNPSEAQIAKLYAAWRLIRESFEVKQTRTEWNDIESIVRRSYRWRAPYVGTGAQLSTNWLGELSNSWLSGARTVEDLSNNRLTIVTFNYDAVVEETFPWIVRSHERFSSTPDDLMPPIIHVHGAIGSPSVDELNAKTYTAAASRIKFISDTLDEPTDAVSTARDALISADKVYSVGFAFEQLNLELLHAGRWGPRTTGLNFDGNAKVTNSMRRIGIGTDRIWSGSDEKFLPAGLAASRGFFEY